MDQSTRKFLNFVSFIPLIFLFAYIFFRNSFLTPYLFVISIGLCFEIWIINTDFLIDNDKINSFIQMEMVLVTFIVWVFVELLLILILGYNKIIINCLYSLETNRIYSVFTSIQSSLGFYEFLTILTLIFLYFYFFSYVKQKKGFIFDYGEEGTKYSIGYVQIMNLFNAFFIILFDIYLFLNEYYFELLLITVTYATTWFIVTSVSRTYINVTSKYEYLQGIYNLINGNCIYSRKTENSNDILNSDKIIDSFVWKFFSIREPSMEVIFLSTFLIFGIGVVFEFNILSILIMESCYFFLYWIAALTLSLPKNQYNIEMKSGFSYNNVFILREYGTGDLLIITENDSRIKVFNHNICNIQEIKGQNGDSQIQLN